MSETPEEKLLKAFIDRTANVPTAYPHDPTPDEASQALASLRQRQEDERALADKALASLDRMQERAEQAEDELNGKRGYRWKVEQLEQRVSDFRVELERSRTQLQQAEQERDAALARVDTGPGWRRAFDATMQQLESQLQQAETALRFYADPENWEDGTLYHYGTGPEDGPETIAERALAALPPNPPKEG